MDEEMKKIIEKRKLNCISIDYTRICKNKNESLKWVYEQNQPKEYIFIDKDILEKTSLRGIYGIFVDDECIYVGRSVNVYIRIFDSRGHIAKVRKRIKPMQQFKEAIETRSSVIKIVLLEEVSYRFDEYHKDMQRLASAENKYIDYFQRIDQCLMQVPEGTPKKERDKWDSNHKIHFGQR